MHTLSTLSLILAFPKSSSLLVFLPFSCRFSFGFEVDLDDTFEPFLQSASLSLESYSFTIEFVRPQTAQKKMKRVFQVHERRHGFSEEDGSVPKKKKKDVTIVTGDVIGCKKGKKSVGGGLDGGCGVCL